MDSRPGEMQSSHHTLARSVRLFFAEPSNEGFALEAVPSLAQARAPAQYHWTRNLHWRLSSCTPLGHALRFPRGLSHLATTFRPLVLQSKNGVTAASGESTRGSVWPGFENGAYQSWRAR